MRSHTQGSGTACAGSAAVPAPQGKAGSQPRGTTLTFVPCAWSQPPHELAAMPSLLPFTVIFDAQRPSKQAPQPAPAEPMQSSWSGNPFLDFQTSGGFASQPSGPRPEPPRTASPLSKSPQQPPPQQPPHSPAEPSPGQQPGQSRAEGRPGQEASGSKAHWPGLAPPGDDGLPSAEQSWASWEPEPQPRRQSGQLPAPSWSWACGRGEPAAAPCRASWRPASWCRLWGAFGSCSGGLQQRRIKGPALVAWLHCAASMTLQSSQDHVLARAGLALCRCWDVDQLQWAQLS